MAHNLYKGYLRLCEKWGVDSSKKGRDLGEFIRQQIVKEFPKGESSDIQNLKECESKLESLNRLVSNQYKNKYHRGRLVSVSGLKYEECKKVLSTEGLEEINNSKLSFIDKVKLSFQRLS